MATPRKSTIKTRTSAPKATAAGPKRRRSAPSAGADAPVEQTRVPRPVAAVDDAPDVVPTAAADPRFKRPDLIEAVAERTALKRADAKVVLELVLQELGRALDENEELVLPPLGKLMVKKRKPDADGPDILTVKIRRPRDGVGETQAEGESPLADPGEDG